MAFFIYYYYYYYYYYCYCYYCYCYYCYCYCYCYYYYYYYYYYHHHHHRRCCYHIVAALHGFVNVRINDTYKIEVADQYRVHTDCSAAD